MTALIHGSRPLRALKIAAAVALGTPATLIWLPFMLPLAFIGPFLLVRDAMASHVNPNDLRGIVFAIGGTVGLAGFWLWVLGPPHRSVRMQRVVGVCWLVGAAVLAAYLLVVPNLNLGPTVLTLAVALIVWVAAMGLAMSLWPRRAPLRT